MKRATNRPIAIATGLVIVFGLWLTPAVLVPVGSADAYAGERGTRGLDLWCSDICPKWYIHLDDYGYSDWLIYWHHIGVPPHEMLSGEWAAAIMYDEIDTWPNAMWLTPFFICPDWISNSAFLISTPIEYPAFPDLSEVHSVIFNNQVQIEIYAKMYCSQTAMGILADPETGAYVESDTCFMVQDYTIKNITPEPIHNIRFYQFLHGQPADEYGPFVQGVYDSDFYPIDDPEFPASQDYHYDITQWRDRTYVGVEYTEYIGFGGIQEPSAYDLWHYRGHAGRPVDGLHVRVENNALAGATSWGPDETAGAEAWYLGTIEPWDSVIVSVLLSVASDPKVIWADGKFDPDPAYIYYKYAFDPMTATAYAGNFEDPYTAEDVASVEVNGIPATIIGVLQSHPGFDGSVVQVEIPIAPFLDDYGAPLDTVIDYFSVTGQFVDSEAFAGAAAVELIGKSSLSGGRQWILPPDEIILHGDVNASGDIDIDDAVNLIAVIFSGGSVAGPFMIADCDCSHSVDVDDAVYLVTYIFANGPFPCHD